MVNALASGGRGMRSVVSRDELPVAMERCALEARRAFGNGDVHVEQLLPQNTHHHPPTTRQHPAMWPDPTADRSREVRNASKRPRQHTHRHQIRPPTIRSGIHPSSTRYALQTAPL
jgi:hypothetical protein